MKLSSILALALVAALGSSHLEESALRGTLRTAETALAAGNLPKAFEYVERALERDRASLDAWDLRVRWAEAAEAEDELLFALHRGYAIARAQGIGRSALKERRERIEELDPVAADLFDMSRVFLDKLRPLARGYEEDGRPHAAIRVHKQILALDPDDASSKEAIERIASLPDPSLAADAKPRDLFEGISTEWIEEHDARHSEWSDRAKLERANYTTYTNAGYVVLVRAAEAMEQMNAFYREFFRHGTEEHGGSVPRIALNIFKTRDEYLELGIGPPVEWSAGHFTGAYVETYIDPGSGFEGTTTTLFHEAAHQFVSLATNAAGWLNEGLASFFEGTRILSNGTVVMNMPANHRLFPLVTRMEKGWMTSHTDGFDPTDTSVTPTKAPTFRIILENRYQWGPPWYAPTWGVVYFLYNYQDPIDGRYLYRDAFSTFIDKSGGRIGNSAVENFEEVVLANPKPPYRGVPRKGRPDVSLAEDVAELDEVWKDWLTALRDRQQGVSGETLPWRDWGIWAAENGDFEVAKEHFEKGLVESPTDIDLLMSFADLLDDHFDNEDRAAKFVAEAIHHLEAADPPDEKAIAKAEKLLSKLDPKLKTLGAIQDELLATAKSIVQRYATAEQHAMVMDVSWRLGDELDMPELFDYYREALDRRGRSIHIWELAYNEESLAGWKDHGESEYTADGAILRAKNGEFDEEGFDYRILTLDRLTSGDFSFEASVLAPKGEVNFCGLVFGRKGTSNFHSLVYFPGKTVVDGVVETGFADLTSFFGSSAFQVWRHLPVGGETKNEGGSSSGEWHTLRVDIAGPEVDMWFDGELLASHEFAGTDVVRGGFGLIVGPGEARFRDIRFLDRDPRDPSGAVERELRMAKLREDSGGAIGGSYLGMKAPFPSVERWAQGERGSWEEKEGSPQLLAFFSVAQNDLVAIDGWLDSLAKEQAENGLEVVCVASFADDAVLDDYLASHTFPGAVGVDRHGDTHLGESFELYSIEKFNLPRLILIDVDGTVLWEGDPGFSANEAWSPGQRSYLTDPLDELLARRRFSERNAWRAEWLESGLPALRLGDLETALPQMQAAAEFEPPRTGELRQAALGLEALEAAAGALAISANAMRREEAEPAFVELLGWRDLLGLELSRADKREYRDIAGSDAVRAWEDLAKAARRLAERDADDEKLTALLTELDAAPGRFPSELAADLRAAQAADDAELLKRHLAEAEGRPRLWLARSYLGW